MLEVKIIDTWLSNLTPKVRDCVRQLTHQGRSSMRQRLDSGYDYNVLIAQDNSAKILGWAMIVSGFEVFYEFDFVKTDNLIMLFVAPYSRRQKIGSQIIDFVLKRYPANNLRHWGDEFVDENFFQKFGIKHVYFEQ